MDELTKAPENKALVPISACLLLAALTDQRQFLRLAGRARSIAVCGVRYWPCLHAPRCPEVTPAEIWRLVAAIPELQPLAEFLASRRESEVAA